MSPPSQRRNEDEERRKRRRKKEERQQRADHDARWLLEKLQNAIRRQSRRDRKNAARFFRHLVNVTTSNPRPLKRLIRAPKVIKTNLYEFFRDTWTAINFEEDEETEEEQVEEVDEELAEKNDPGKVKVLVIAEEDEEVEDTGMVAVSVVSEDDDDEEEHPGMVQVSGIEEKHDEEEDPGMVTDKEFDDAGEQLPSSILATTPTAVSDSTVAVRASSPPAAIGSRKLSSSSDEDEDEEPLPATRPAAEKEGEDTDEVEEESLSTAITSESELSELASGELGADGENNCAPPTAFEKYVEASEREGVAATTAALESAGGTTSGTPVSAQVVSGGFNPVSNPVHSSFLLAAVQDADNNREERKKRNEGKKKVEKAAHAGLARRGGGSGGAIKSPINTETKSSSSRSVVDEAASRHPPTPPGRSSSTRVPPRSPAADGGNAKNRNKKRKRQVISSSSSGSSSCGSPRPATRPIKTQRVLKRTQPSKKVRDDLRKEETLVFVRDPSHKKVEPLKPRAPAKKPTKKRPPKERVRCRQCLQTFCNRYVHDRHVRELHPPDGRPGVFQCGFCPQQLRSERNRRDHERAQHSNQPGKFQCPHCGMRFTNRQAMNSHAKRCDYRH